MRSLITPFISAYWSSNGYLQRQDKRYEQRLQKANHPRKTELFVALDDPYSYILLQVMPQFCKDFNLDLQIHLIHRRQPEMFPEERMWSLWAINDATQLAQLYDLYIPSYHPQSTRISQAQAYWAKQPPSSAQEALARFEQVWLEKDIPVYKNDPKPMLRLNEKHMQKLGHYLPASIYFAGQWYWGLDRLEHLESRFLQLKFNSSPYPESKYNRTWQNFTQYPANMVRNKHQPVELYFSMRSPYSHLALQRCHQLTQHYGIPLIIKPVMPMLMRNMAVPKNKTHYIFFDALRESHKLNIPYGKVADPLGKGVENTYAIWHWAAQKGKGNEFLLAISMLVNAQGISAHYHSGLKHACQLAGLNWIQAKHALKHNAWRNAVRRNLDELYSMGLWGVPSMRYGKTQVWGQDRIWCIEDAIVDPYKDQSTQFEAID